MPENNARGFSVRVVSTVRLVGIIRVENNLCSEVFVTRLHTTCILKEKRRQTHNDARSSAVCVLGNFHTASTLDSHYEGVDANIIRKERHYDSRGSGVHVD